VHPEDSYYFLAATTLAAELYESRPMEIREKLRVNIYCRMLDAARNYRWSLIQYVARYYNEQGRIESTLGVMTDLSSFEMVKKPMMTVIDNNNKEHQYFKVLTSSKKLEPLSIPHITKREQEIVHQMIKGLNTPQIAATLNISYHTVENHKRNLRKKTATKTSAELVYLMKSNCLI
jgi:DNA-binding CsgD family transcriptional regulator